MEWFRDVRRYAARRDEDNSKRINKPSCDSAAELDIRGSRPPYRGDRGPSQGFRGRGHRGGRFGHRTVIGTSYRVAKTGGWTEQKLEERYGSQRNTHFNDQYDDSNENDHWRSRSHHRTPRNQSSHRGTELHSSDGQDCSDAYESVPAAYRIQLKRYMSGHRGHESSRSRDRDHDGLSFNRERERSTSPPHHREKRKPASRNGSPTDSQSDDSPQSGIIRNTGSDPPVRSGTLNEHKMEHGDQSDHSSLANSNTYKRCKSRIENQSDDDEKRGEECLRSGFKNGCTPRIRSPTAEKRISDLGYPIASISSQNQQSHGRKRAELCDDRLTNDRSSSVESVRMDRWLMWREELARKAGDQPSLESINIAGEPGQNRDSSKDNGIIVKPHGCSKSIETSLRSDGRDIPQINHESCSVLVSNVNGSQHSITSDGFWAKLARKTTFICPRTVDSRSVRSRSRGKTYISPGDLSISALCARSRKFNSLKSNCESSTSRSGDDSSESSSKIERQLSKGSTRSQNLKCGKRDRSQSTNSSYQSENDTEVERKGYRINPKTQAAYEPAPKHSDSSDSNYLRHKRVKRRRRRRQKSLSCEFAVGKLTGERRLQIHLAGRREDKLSDAESSDEHVTSSSSAVAFSRHNKNCYGDNGQNVTATKNGGTNLSECCKTTAANKLISDCVQNPTREYSPVDEIVMGMLTGATSTVAKRGLDNVITDSRNQGVPKPISHGMNSGTSMITCCEVRDDAYDLADKSTTRIGDYAQKAPDRVENNVDSAETVALVTDAEDGAEFFYPSNPVDSGAVMSPDSTTLHVPSKSSEETNRMSSDFRDASVSKCVLKDKSHHSKKASNVFKETRSSPLIEYDSTNGQFNLVRALKLPGSDDTGDSTYSDCPDTTVTLDIEPAGKYSNSPPVRSQSGKGKGSGSKTEITFRRGHSAEHLQLDKKLSPSPDRFENAASIFESPSFSNTSKCVDPTASRFIGSCNSDEPDQVLFQTDRKRRSMRKQSKKASKKNKTSVKRRSATDSNRKITNDDGEAKSDVSPVDNASVNGGYMENISRKSLKRLKKEKKLIKSTLRKLERLDRKHRSDASNHGKLHRSSSALSSAKNIEMVEPEVILVYDDTCAEESYSTEKPLSASNEVETLVTFDSGPMPDSTHEKSVIPVSDASLSVREGSEDESSIDDGSASEKVHGRCTGSSNPYKDVCHGFGAIKHGACSPENDQGPNSSALLTSDTEHNGVSQDQSEVCGQPIGVDNMESAVQKSSGNQLRTQKTDESGRFDVAEAPMADDINSTDASMKTFQSQCNVLANDQPKELNDVIPTQCSKNISMPATNHEIHSTSNIDASNSVIQQPKTSNIIDVAAASMHPDPLVLSNFHVQKRIVNSREIVVNVSGESAAVFSQPLLTQCQKYGSNTSNDSAVLSKVVAKLLCSGVSDGQHKTSHDEVTGIAANLSAEGSDSLHYDSNGSVCTKPQDIDVVVTNPCIETSSESSVVLSGGYSRVLDSTAEGVVAQTPEPTEKSKQATTNHGLDNYATTLTSDILSLAGVPSAAADSRSTAVYKQLNVCGKKPSIDITNSEIENYMCLEDCHLKELHVSIPRLSFCSDGNRFLEGEGSISRSKGLEHLNLRTGYSAAGTQAPEFRNRCRKPNLCKRVKPFMNQKLSTTDVFRRTKFAARLRNHHRYVATKSMYQKNVKHNSLLSSILRKYKSSRRPTVGGIRRMNGNKCILTDRPILFQNRHISTLHRSGWSRHDLFHSKATDKMNHSMVKTKAINGTQLKLSNLAENSSHKQSDDSACLGDTVHRMIGNPTIIPRKDTVKISQKMVSNSTEPGCNFSKVLAPEILDVLRCIKEEYICSDTDRGKSSGPDDDNNMDSKPLISHESGERLLNIDGTDKQSQPRDTSETAIQQISFPSHDDLNLSEIAEYTRTLLANSQLLTELESKMPLCQLEDDGQERQLESTSQRSIDGESIDLVQLFSWEHVDQQGAGGSVPVGCIPKQHLQSSNADITSVVVSLESTGSRQTAEQHYLSGADSPDMLCKDADLPTEIDIRTNSQKEFLSGYNCNTSNHSSFSGHGTFERKSIVQNPAESDTEQRHNVNLASDVLVSKIAASKYNLADKDDLIYDPDVSVGKHVVVNDSAIVIDVDTIANDTIKASILCGKTDVSLKSERNCLSIENSKGALEIDSKSSHVENFDIDRIIAPHLGAKMKWFDQLLSGSSFQLESVVPRGKVTNNLFNTSATLSSTPVTDFSIDRGDWQAEVKGMGRDGKLAILHKVQEQMEKAYVEDCETFAMVTKVLLSKDPQIEKSLVACLRSSLRDVGHKYITVMRQIARELFADEAAT